MIATQQNCLLARRMTWLVMHLQTGVDPERLQAARKAQKKRRDKANVACQNPPHKMCVKVSLASPLLSLLCTQTALLTVQTLRITRPDLRDGFPKTSQLSKKPVIRFARSPVRGRQRLFYPRLFVLELQDLRWQKYSHSHNI